MTPSTFLGPCRPRSPNVAVMLRLSYSGVVVLLLASCAKPSPTSVRYNPLFDPRDDVRALLVSAYDALEAHDAERLAGVLTADAMMFGLGPSDTYQFREPAIEALRQAWADGQSDLRLTPGRMPVGLAVGARSAWVWDFPRGEVGWSVYLPRITAHAIHDGERWRFDALHVSLGVPDTALYAHDATKKFVAPADVAPEHSHESDPLIEVTRRILGDLAFKVARTSEGADVVLLGTDPLEVFEGGQAFKAMVKPRLSEIQKAVFEYRVEGPFRARMAPDGRTGWVAANVVLRVGSGRKAQTLPTFRTLWCYEKDAQTAEWKLVLEHQSVALRDEQRERASPEHIKARDARESQKPPLAPKVREASDGGFGTFE